MKEGAKVFVFELVPALESARLCLDTMPAGTMAVPKELLARGRATEAVEAVEAVDGGVDTLGEIVGEAKRTDFGLEEGIACEGEAFLANGLLRRGPEPLGVKDIVDYRLKRQGQLIPICCTAAALMLARNVTFSRWIGGSQMET